MSDSGDTSSEQTTASTDSQDFEINQPDLRTENSKQLELQNRVDVIVNLTCLNEKTSTTFETTQPSLGPVPPEQEDIQAYNENTPKKGLPTEPTDMQALEKVDRNFLGTPESVDHVKVEGGGYEEQNSPFEFISKKNSPVRSSEVVRKLDYDYKSNTRLPNNMKVTTEYEDDDFGDDYAFDNLHAVHDSGIKEELEDEKKPFGSDELYPFKRESVCLKNDTDLEQWSQIDTRIHSPTMDEGPSLDIETIIQRVVQENNDEENPEDFEKEASVSPEQDAHFKPGWQDDFTRISHSDVLDTTESAFRRKEVEDKPKLTMTGRSKRNNSQMCLLYREDDFSWKPRDSAFCDKQSILGNKRNTAIDRYATNIKNTGGLDTKYSSNWEGRNGYAWENNTIDDNTRDGQSPSSDEAPILDIETIIQRAVEEEEKKEIVKKESHFLEYINTKKETPSSASKNDWTKDKSGFFESVLACETNVDEDELPNLVDSSTVDAVLYGKTAEPSRTEGNSEKRNRLKRKTSNRNQEKISTPDKIRKVEKDDQEQWEQFQSLLKSEEDSTRTESEGRDTEDEGNRRSKLPTLSVNNGNEENVSSSSKIEMIKAVSQVMSKKKLSGNLERSVANLPSFEEESDGEQRGNNDESTEPYEDLEQVGKQTTNVQTKEKASTTVDESVSNGNDSVDKPVGIKNNSCSSGNTDNDDMLLDIVDEAINVVKKTIKKTRTKKKKTKSPISLKTDGKLSGLKNTTERSSVTLEETERGKTEFLFANNSKSEEDIENAATSLGEFGRNETVEKHEMTAAAEEPMESSDQTPDKQEIEIESDAIKNWTEKQENTEMNKIDVKYQAVDLLKERQDNFKNSDNEKFQDRKGKLETPVKQLKSPSCRKKIGKRRKDKMDELMKNRDWKETLGSFKKGKPKRDEEQVEDQRKLTIGQAIKLAATSRKKSVVNSSDSITSGSSSDELFKADLKDKEESESEKPTRVLRKRKAPTTVKKETNLSDCSSETSAEDDEIKKHICMSPVVKMTKLISEPSSSSEDSLQPMEDANGRKEAEKLPSQAEEMLQNQKSESCDQNLGGNSTSGTEEYDPTPLDPVKKSPGKPSFQSPKRMLSKRKSTKSETSTDRYETTSEEPNLSQVKPSLKSPARLSKRLEPSQENAVSRTQSTSSAEEYSLQTRELNEKSDQKNNFRKISFRSPRKTSKKRNSPRCNKISKFSSTESSDQAVGSFDKDQSLNVSTDNTLTTASSGSLVKVDGPQDRRLSLRKKKQLVPIVIVDSTTTSEEVTGLDRSADYTTSIHDSLSRDSDADAS